MLTQSGISMPLQAAMQQQANTYNGVSHVIKAESKGNRVERERPRLLRDSAIPSRRHANPMHGVDNLAIVDIFELYRKGDKRYHSLFDPDRNGVMDISHGEMVAGAYLAKKSGGKVHPYKVRGEKGMFCVPVPTSILQQLNKLYQDIDSGKSIDGVNLSIGTEMPYKLIASNAKRLQRKLWYNPKRHNGLTAKDLERLAVISPKTVGQSSTKKALRKMVPLISKADDKAIKLIEKIRSKGVPVFLAAGNDKSQKTFDLWGLSKGITVVSGQTSSTHKKINRKRYTDNSEVDGTAQAEYNMRPTCNRHGQITGVDFNGDGKREFKLRHKTGRWVKNPYPISGTSFASPTFAGQYRKPAPSLFSLA